MLLAIDIGNTNIILGVFEGEVLKTTIRLSSGIHRMPDEYAAGIIYLLERRKITISDITDAVLCSVVPPLVTTFEEICKQYFNISPLIIEAGVKTGVRICMDNPREVGADRIVNAVAAHKLYRGPVIVIDLGTATTFDAVSETGDYLGGAIAPGIAIATEALFTRTAALPRVELIYPQKAIGTNTIAAMQSGIVFGYIGMIEGIVKRIRQELGARAKVVATGGYSRIITKETSVIDIINPDLTLIGLNVIYQMNKLQRHG